MIPSNTWPHTHTDLVQHYHQQYWNNIRSGRYEPLVYPWSGLGAIAIIAYLLIPYRNQPWLRAARYPLFALYFAHTVYTIRIARALDFASCMGIGLLMSWGLIWTFSIMILHDPQLDYQRIERTEGFFKLNRKLEVRSGDGTADSNGMNDYTNGSTAAGHDMAHGTMAPNQRHGKFAWQPYPLTPFVERIDWVLDIFSNFRGQAWNWRTDATPPPPKSVQDDLRKSSTNPPDHNFRLSPYQVRAYTTRSDLLKENWKLLIWGYIFLDVLKTCIVHDPYFWGMVDNPPAPYLPNFYLSSPILIKAFRLTVVQFAVKTALESIFCLGPLFFSGLLGSSLIGARAEPWMYPATWGSYSVVLDKGLAGWWGAWWHQTFRYAFEQPSKKLLQVFGWNPKAPFARLLQLSIAFTLSGTLHATGSYTAHGPSNPVTGSMYFFLLQIIGVFLESIVRQSLAKTGVQSHVPRWVKRTFTFIYVQLWLYHTGPFLSDDFARAGVWLFEPIPISPLRALGFGTEGDGWWCWAGWGLRLHRGAHWWKSGIAF